MHYIVYYHQHRYRHRGCRRPPHCHHSPHCFESVSILGCLVVFVPYKLTSVLNIQRMFFLHEILYILHISFVLSHYILDSNCLYHMFNFILSLSLSLHYYFLLPLVSPAGRSNFHRIEVLCKFLVRSLETHEAGSRQRCKMLGPLKGHWQNSYRF